MNIIDGRYAGVERQLIPTIFISLFIPFYLYSVNTYTFDFVNRNVKEK